MNSRKKYGAAGHYFHSCANKETTDHYLQSRCANKNPRATIRTAALPIRIHVSLIRTAALRIAASELASYEITHLCYMLGWTLILSVYFFGFSANMLHQQNTDHIFFPRNFMDRNFFHWLIYLTKINQGFLKICVLTFKEDKKMNDSFTYCFLFHLWLFSQVLTQL